jgi:hypothetical protein
LKNREETAYDLYNVRQQPAVRKLSVTLSLAAITNETLDIRTWNYVLKLSMNFPINYVEAGVAQKVLCLNRCSISGRGKIFFL